MTRWARTKQAIRDFVGMYRSGHQDFVVRRGAPIPADTVVGRSNDARWRIMAPVFDHAVAGRRVLDIGAHLGFFSLKALEHGASHVTSLELLPELTARMARIKARHRRALCPGGRDRWTILRGDFYDDLVPVDTVFMFGITYHMVRHGMQRGVLPQEDAYRALFRRIAEIAGHGVLAEWGPPKRPSFEPSPYWDQFSYEQFQKALVESFPHAVYLGHHEYYGAGRQDPTRHIHYAAKTGPLPGPGPAAGRPA